MTMNVFEGLSSMTLSLMLPNGIWTAPLKENSASSPFSLTSRTVCSGCFSSSSQSANETRPSMTFDAVNPAMFTGSFALE